MFGQASYVNPVLLQVCILMQKQSSLRKGSLPLAKVVALDVLRLGGIEASCSREVDHGGTRSNAAGWMMA